MYNTERSVDECRIHKFGDNMTITKTSMISLNTFGDNRFYGNNIESYPLDENLYLFKRDLVNKICEMGSPIENASVELLRRSLDGDKDLLINNINDRTINDDRKLNLAANTLYNDLL